MHNRSTLVRTKLAAACLTIALLAGCGGGGGGGGGSSKGAGEPNDKGKVISLVSSLSEYSKTLDQLKTHFTADAKLTEDDRKKYLDYTAAIQLPIQIDKDSATIPVMIKDGKGKELGVKQWTAVKEGDTWKLKSAPL